MICRSFASWTAAAGLLLGLLLGAASASAQGLAVEDYRPAKPGQTIQGYAGWSHMFDTDIDQNGHFYRNDAAVGLRGKVGITDDLSIDPIFRYELNAYDFGSADPFRWESINQFIVGALLTWKLGDEWALLGGPVFRYAGEKGADFHRSVQGGALFGFMYSASESLKLGLLIGAISGIEESASIVPIPTVDWRFADDFRLNLGLQHLGGRTGLGGEVGWTFMEEWELAAGAQIQNRRYRLDRNGVRSANYNTPLDARDGVGEERSVPVYARITHTPTENASLDIFAGAAFAGDLRVEKKSGNRIASSEYDTAPVIGIRAHVAF